MSVKISQMAVATNLTDAVVPIVQGGVNKQADASLFTGDYKKYVALISQLGTDNPTLIVLENTIGNIVWTRANNGVYYGELTNAFVDNKTALFINHSNFLLNYFVSMTRNSATRIAIETAQNDIQADNLLDKTTIEIRVYN